MENIFVILNFYHRFIISHKTQVDKSFPSFSESVRNSVTLMMYLSNYDKIYSRYQLCNSKCYLHLDQVRSKLSTQCSYQELPILDRLEEFSILLSQLPKYQILILIYYYIWYKLSIQVTAKIKYSQDSSLWRSLLAIEILKESSDRLVKNFMDITPYLDLMNKFYECGIFNCFKGFGFSGLGMIIDDIYVHTTPEKSKRTLIKIGHVMLAKTFFFRNLFSYSSS